MLFNLLLANITTLLCFFLFFLVISNSFLMIPVVNEKAKLKLTLAISSGAPKILEKEIIDNPPLIADKTIKALSK